MRSVPDVPLYGGVNDPDNGRQALPAEPAIVAVSVEPVVSAGEGAQRKLPLAPVLPLSNSPERPLVLDYVPFVRPGVGVAGVGQLGLDL